MQDLPTIAAQAWATAHAPSSHDPVQFGHNVALVAQSCAITQYSNDPVATAAALALLSVKGVGASAGDELMRSAGFSDRGPLPNPPASEGGESETPETPKQPRPPLSPSAGEIVSDVFSAMQSAQIHTKSVKAPDGSLGGTRLLSLSEVAALKKGRPENAATSVAGLPADRKPAEPAPFGGAS